jgi:hypothetical protein
MCNGESANSTIETCNSCNCVQGGWTERHRQQYPDQPLIFTENEGWFQEWGQAIAIRTTTSIASSVAEWFAAGGAYHAYYMWFGGNNYGRTAASGITTLYADDVCLHSDGTPNEPKYTQLSRLQHFVADHAKILLSQDSVRIPLPWWDGRKWANGTQQFVYSYPPYFHFLSNEFDQPLNVLFLNQSILMPGSSVRIYDYNLNILWDSDNYSDINSDNTKIFPIVMGPLQWQTWTESNRLDLPKITSLTPLEQLNITNDETIYLWYRRNVTLQQAQANTIVTVQTRKANALLFFLDGQYLGEFDDHDHSAGGVEPSIAFDLSHFKPNQQYLFEILSVSLGLNNGIGPHSFENKGIVGNVWLDGELLIDNQTNINLWEHQKGLIGEYLQIYTPEGSSKVDWNPEWAKGIGKPITWFQTRFDLDHLVKEDTNANPVLLDAHGLNRGHVFINGNDLGLYWLIQGICIDAPTLHCQQSQINCLEPVQRYYHIPSDWLMPKNNLLTIFADLGARSPGSVSIVQRVVTN